jgi:enoyl-CoA hydratase/carnithine racemase
MSDTAPLIVETLAPGVRQIRLNRPERLNALGVEMVEALRRAVEAEDGARVLLIRGTGRGFCAGADLKERSGMDQAARLSHNRAINAAVDAVAVAPMPTIAVVNGLALGGGCELAIACDLRFAASSATIGLTEARIGAIPGAGGTQRLPRLIGARRDDRAGASGCARRRPGCACLALCGFAGLTFAAHRAHGETPCFAGCGNAVGRWPGARTCSPARCV